MDSAGVGALPDAQEYHDRANANTIANVAQGMGGLHLPNFERLGLGHVTPLRGVAADAPPAFTSDTMATNTATARLPNTLNDLIKPPPCFR